MLTVKNVRNFFSIHSACPHLKNTADNIGCIRVNDRCEIFVRTFFVAVCTERCHILARLGVAFKNGSQLFCLYWLRAIR